MKSSKESRDLRVLVDAERQYGVNRMRASVCAVDSDGRVRGAGPSDDPLNYIVCECYVREEAEFDRPAGELWGWGVYADGMGRLDHAEAKALADTLARIERAMSRMREEEGTAESFGAYLNRFARAIRATKVGRNRAKPGDEPRWWGVGDASFVVDRVRWEHFPTREERERDEQAA